MSYSNMDEFDIPIDIHTSKLLDWLISRRHVKRDWQKNIVNIREKINEAIKDMPENKEITSLLTGSYINYFHCQKLIEKLKETEANSKNLFGQYSSKRMKDWLEIVKLYTKDNIYLAEAASLLLRNVNYEIPALKKQITKTMNQRNECERKEVDYEKLAECNRKEYAASCRSLGIKGEKIKKELIEKANDFPNMNKKIAAEIKSLKAVMEFYQKIVDGMLDNKDKALKMLNYVIENGDSTVYQWKYKKAPSSLEIIKLNVEEEDENVGNDDSIDFGTDINLNEEENIDWGITAEESEPVTRKEEVEESVAKGEEARTVLGHPNTRNFLINNLLELEAFLKVRIFEIKSESDGLTSSIHAELLQSYGMNSLSEMLENVQSVLSSLRNSVSVHYLNIITNAGYVDQLSEKLRHKLNTAEKMLASKDFVTKQKEEIMKETESLNLKVELLIQKTKDLQKLIEEDISKKYNGRPVNLIAGANLL